MTFTRCQIVTRSAPQATSITKDGKFNRAAIMQAAVNGAFRSKSSGLPWRVLMKSALTLAWSRAKAELAQHVRVEAERSRRQAANPIPAPRPVAARRWSRPLAISGARAHSHAW